MNAFHGRGTIMNAFHGRGTIMNAFHGCGLVVVNFAGLWSSSFRVLVPPEFSDSDHEGDHTKTKHQVSKESAKFLNDCYKHSLTNISSLEVRNQYPLPKMASTRTPQLDSYMKAEVSATTKTERYQDYSLSC